MMMAALLWRRGETAVILGVPALNIGVQDQAWASFALA